MKKKKFLCFLLILTLCFSSTIPFYVEAAETETESESLTKKIASGLGAFLTKVACTPFDFATDINEGFIKGVDTVLADNMQDWINNGYIIPDGNENYKFLPQVTNVINNYFSQFISKCDNYVIISPSRDDNPLSFINSKYHLDSNSLNKIESYFDLENCNVFWVNANPEFTIVSRTPYFYLDSSARPNTYWNILPYFPNNTPFTYKRKLTIINNGSELQFSNFSDTTPFNNVLVSDFGDGLVYQFDLNTRLSCFYGLPYMVFYNKLSLESYLNGGKTYLPVIPSTITIPKKYIDNPTLLPDITYNIDKSNKTEEVIQNEYNTIINNYITNIDGSGGSGGDSSGDSGGGSGGDSGGDSGGGNITDTKLYDFLTKLWNESDKKFDKMIDLLETNNKYQKKLVDSLNDIKAILVTQTVFDVFKNRSTETANKAKEKFPTSIPWDVAMVLNAMSAEPQELKFSLPIQVKSFGINESIEIDLSSEEWAKLAKTCRYLLSITFILILIQLTRKLFSYGGDD